MCRMAERQSSRPLLESPLGRVYDVVCRTPRSGYGALMLNAVTQIGLPRRGAFLIERRGETAVVDTNTYVVRRRAVPAGQRVSKNTPLTD